MSDTSDLRIEQILRAAMRAETRDVPVTLTTPQIMSRRSGKQRARRTSWRGPVLLAATLMVATGAALAWSLATPPSDLPAAPDPHRLLVIRGLDDQNRWDGSTGLDVSLLSVDGTTESVARIPARWVPDDLEFPVWSPMWPSPDVITFNAVSTTVDDRYLVSIDLADPNPGVDIARGPSLPAGSDSGSGTIQPQVCSPEDGVCRSGVEASIKGDPSRDASYRAWVALQATTLIDESASGNAIWAGDGGIWYVTSRTVGDTRSAYLTRVVPDGSTTTSPPMGIPPGYLPMIESSSPGDGLVAVRYLSGSGDLVALIDPLTGAGVSVPGYAGGWADTDRVARLARSGLAIDPPMPLGASGAAHRVLESFEFQVARFPIARILMAHEEPASTTPVVFETGQIAVDSSHDVSLECAGPGQVHILARTGLPSALGPDRDCDQYSGGLIGSTWRDPTDVVSMTLQADPGVAWRLVIFESTEVP